MKCQVYSITYDTIEFKGNKADCKKHIKILKEAERELNLPEEEEFIIERSN